MSASTLYSAASGVPAAAHAAQPGLLRRMFDRFIESRMRRAEEFIRDNSHLLPDALENQARWKITPRSEDSLPFLK